VHRNKFLFNNQPDAIIIKSYSVIKLHVSGIFSAHHHRVFYCTFGTGKFHAGSGDRFQAESGWNFHSILPLLGRGHQTCMKLTSAECTVVNSWWWADKMPETCRVL